MQKLFVYILFFFFILSCDDVVPIQDNPLDPGNEDYVEPTVTFLSELNNGDIVSTETLSLAWQGNELVTEYRYKLDSFSWTDWFEGASVTLEYLDEGEHIISIQSRYLSGDTSEVVSRLFIVDAVDGPSLIFFPRRHISTQGETVTFHVLAEEVTALMAAEIHLGFDQSKLEIISVTQGSLFQNSQESIFSYELSSGSIEVLTTLLSSSSPSVSGTGDLIQIEVKSLQPGLASIYFNSNNRFRDPNNLNISIREFVNARVEVQ
jgi:hypothetical protein